MKKVFLVFSLLALSESNVFGMDTPERLNSESCKEGQVENQRNLDVTDVAVQDSDEQSRKRNRGAEDEEHRKMARTDQFKVEEAIEHHVGMFQNGFTSTSTSTDTQHSEPPRLSEKRIRETFLLKKHAVLGCYELTQRILSNIPHIDQVSLREVVDYFQFPDENPSFTYAQEMQQKIQQEIKDGSTNPGGCPAIHVTELTLQVKPKSEEEWIALDQKFPNLRVLNARNLRLQTKDITSLVQLFPYLISLDISGNFEFSFGSGTRNGDAGVQALAANTSWSLQYLNLSHNFIGYAGAEALVRNTSWDLQYLNLLHNHITNTGVQALSQNTSWDLRYLNLCDNSIRDRGVQALSQNTSWNLQTLHLSNNQIGDAGAEALTQNTSWNLQRLDLSGNDISLPSREALLKLPHLEVFFCYEISAWE